MNMDHFLNMGGYARYVWPSYGLGLLVVLWNVASALRAHRDALAAALRQASLQPQGDAPAAEDAP
jgi:heme exporter protein CcmD